MAGFRCSLVTPTHQLYNGIAYYAEVPGEDGSFGILANHESIVATHRPGIATIWADEEGKDKKSFFLYQGCTSMVDNNVIIMAHMAIPVEDITVDEAKENIERMQARVSELEEKAGDASGGAAATLDVAQQQLDFFEHMLKIAEAGASK